MFEATETPADRRTSRPPDSAPPQWRTGRSPGGRMGRVAVVPVLLVLLSGCGSSGTGGDDPPASDPPESSAPERSTRPTRSTAPPRTTVASPSVIVEPTTEPATDPAPAPPRNDPARFLGTTYADQEFLDYLTANGCYRGVAVRLVCPDVGVEFAIDDTHRVSAVFFAPGYAGALPGGVAFGSTPQDVVARLGEPDTSTSTSMTWRTMEGVSLIVSFPIDPAAAVTVNQVSLQLR